MAAVKGEAEGRQGKAVVGRRAQALIAALLTEPTHAAAAAKAGVGERTLHRWLRRPEFEAAYREARRRIVDEAVGVLQRGAKASVETLLRNLNCGMPAAEIRAAQVVLDQVMKGTELLDVLARVDVLEKLLAEVQNRGDERPAGEAAGTDGEAGPAGGDGPGVGGDPAEVPDDGLHGAGI